jgi:hypothetical protein
MDLLLQLALALELLDRSSTYRSHRVKVQTAMRMGMMEVGKGGIIALVRALRLLECMYAYNLTDNLLASSFYVAPNGRLAGILSDRSSISHHGVIKSSAFSDVNFDASVAGSSDIQGWGGFHCS